MVEWREYIDVWVSGGMRSIEVDPGEKKIAMDQDENRLKNC
jgi:hypothetical protein